MPVVEKIYEYDDAMIGDESPPYVFHVTANDIRNYCDAVRNYNPVYLDEETACQGEFREMVPPPTMAYSYAPMRRFQAIMNRGFTPPEISRTRPGWTPFTKSEIKFLTPVKVGDTITSTTRLADKYEKRGNKFFTWLITGFNQHGERVVEYTYTCLVHYAAGQKKS